MEKIFIKASEICIELIFDSTVPFGEREELLLNAYIPGVSVSTISPSSTIKLFYYFNKEKKSLQIEEGGILIRDDWSRVVPIYFFHLIHSIALKQWHTKHLFSVHSASFGNEDELSLIIGYSGSGKTTTALNLLKEKGIKLFSSNKTLVTFERNNLIGLAGTRTITCKMKDFDKYESLAHNPVIFGNRTAFKIQKENWLISKKIRVKNIFLIQLNDYLDEFFKLDKFESLVHLLPFFLDYNNSDIILFSGTQLFDGTVNPSIVKPNLLVSLNETLPEINIYVVSGSLEHVIKKITNLHEK
jgi:hypothetical protein